MTKILFLFPSAETAEYAKKVLQEPFPDILIDHCPPSESAHVVAKYMRDGVGIVCARGGISHVLWEAKVDVALVGIPITAFEIIKAINRAKIHGKNIAVIAHAQMVIGIDFLAASIGGEVQQYSVKYNQNYEKAVQKAVEDGAEVVIGGVLASKAAKKSGVPYSLIEFGQEGLLQAAKEATQIREALEIETAKRQMLITVIASSPDGIITVDADKKILEVNRAAEQLLRKSRTSLLGKKIATAIPKLPLLPGAKKNPAMRQAIITLNKNKVVCDVEPIQHNEKSFGAVLRLRNADSIQETEAMIRRELYAKGHVARFKFSDIIGDSAEIKESISMARDYADTNSSVLILGETGTGKEVFAQSIHNASARSRGPFVAINCAAIPTHLLESELFGYVGGAFTGASKEGKPGLLEVAHGGTIFLDEMAEMDYANQGRLLRFHQERSVVRLGSHKVIPVDVRVIVATNKNLEEMVEKNAFRDDLYYRLNVLRLELPPLRYRKGDVSLYARYFLQQFADEAGKTLRMSRDAEKLLEEYTWPGNVRECRNIMERAVARLKSGMITAAMLHPIISPSQRFSKQIPTRVNRQKQEIVEALEKTSGNYGETARLLGVNRSTLYRRMKKYGITY